MKEAATGTVTVPGCDPATFLTLLRFLYTSELKVDATNSKSGEGGELEGAALLELARAADYYLLPRLRARATARLRELAIATGGASSSSSAEARAALAALMISVADE
eukprot:tig00020912_g15843.t1